MALKNSAGRNHLLLLFGLGGTFFLWSIAVRTAGYFGLISVNERLL